MSWTHIQGHERWIDVFAEVVRHNRLGHAYLFLGPPGIGKRLFALELAKTLLCEGRGDAFAACDQCPACLLMDAGTHPDFFTYQRWLEEKLPREIELKDDDKYFVLGNSGWWLKKEMPVSLMRDEVLKDLSLKPARGHGRIALLDDADDINAESANCFLKTLEEPPPRSLFILIGTSRDQQLDTVLSRCQIVRFAPLAMPLVESVLRKQGVAEELLPRLATLCEGSPGHALALADPTVWDFRQTLLTGLAGPNADVVALAKAWTQFAEEAGKEAAAQRRRAAVVLRLLQAFLADALAVSLGGQPRTQEAVDRNLLFQLCERAGPEKILALLERTLETERHLDRYLQVALVVEALLVGGEW